jgi:hypothetical protein
MSIIRGSTLMVSGAMDGGLLLTPTLDQLFQEHITERRVIHWTKKDIHSVVLSPDARLVACTIPNQVVRVWSLDAMLCKLHRLYLALLRRNMDLLTATVNSSHTNLFSVRLARPGHDKRSLMLVKIVDVVLCEKWSERSMVEFLKIMLSSRLVVEDGLAIEDLPLREIAESFPDAIVEVMRLCSIEGDSTVCYHSHKRLSVTTDSRAMYWQGYPLERHALTRASPGEQRPLVEPPSGEAPVDGLADLMDGDDTGDSMAHGAAMLELRDGVCSACGGSRYIGHGMQSEPQRKRGRHAGGDTHLHMFATKGSAHGGYSCGMMRHGLDQHGVMRQGSMTCTCDHRRDREAGEQARPAAQWSLHKSHQLRRDRPSDADGGPGLLDEDDAASVHEQKAGANSVDRLIDHNGDQCGELVPGQSHSHVDQAGGIGVGMSGSAERERSGGALREAANRTATRSSGSESIEVWLRRMVLARAPLPVPVRELVVNIADVCNVPVLRGLGRDPLDLFAELELHEVFATAAVRCMLSHRWQQVQHWFVLQLVLYMLFLGLLTQYSAVIANDRLERTIGEVVSAHTTQVVLACIGLALNLWFMFVEISELAVFGFRRYIRDIWNVVDVSVHLIVSCVAVLHGIRSPWEYFFGAVAAVLMWIRLLAYSRGIRGPGIFMRIIFRMTTSIMFFLVVLCVVVMGFSVAFMLIFRARNAEHATIGTSFVFGFSGAITGTLPLLFRDMDGFDNLLGDREELYYLQLVAYCLFLTIVPVLLMNLLIALLFDIYDRLHIEADLHFRLEKTKLLLALEALFPRWPHRLSAARWLHALAPRDSDLWARDDTEGDSGSAVASVSAASERDRS